MTQLCVDSYCKLLRFMRIFFVITMSFHPIGTEVSFTVLYLIDTSQSSLTLTFIFTKTRRGLINKQNISKWKEKRVQNNFRDKQNTNRTFIIENFLNKLVITTYHWRNSCLKVWLVYQRLVLLHFGILLIQGNINVLWPLKTWRWYC